MITESELLDTFDLDELDEKQHLCMFLLWSQDALENARKLKEDIHSENKHATIATIDRKTIVLASLTLDDMRAFANRWSFVRAVEPMDEGSLPVYDDEII